MDPAHIVHAITCFYVGRQDVVKQRCGGPVQFGVKGFFTTEKAKIDAVYDLYLCHEHRRWWNKSAASGIIWIPPAVRIKAI